MSSLKRLQVAMSEGIHDLYTTIKYKLEPWPNSIYYTIIPNKIRGGQMAVILHNVTSEPQPISAVIPTNDKFYNYVGIAGGDVKALKYAVIGDDFKELNNKVKVSVDSYIVINHNGDVSFKGG